MDPIQKIYAEKGTIAVVGASNNPARPSCEITRYLKREGFRVIPVNPRFKELFGEKCYSDLLSVPGPIDVVDIFRNSSAVPDIVEQAIAKKAKVVWMQPGAENMQAAERATEAGLEVIMGVCIMHNAFAAQMAHEGGR
jgi:predicted CoA-binding protein